MKTSTLLTFLATSVSVIHAYPGGTKTQLFTDTHGSGWEIHTWKKRGEIAAATPVPHAPPALGAAAPSRRNAEAAPAPAAAADDQPPLYYVPIPGHAIAAAGSEKREASPEPDAAPEANAEASPEAEADANSAVQLGLPLAFAPIPTQGIEAVVSANKKRSPTSTDWAAKLASILTKIKDRLSSNSNSASTHTKREAEAEAEALPEPEAFVNAPSLDLSTDDLPPVFHASSVPLNNRRRDASPEAAPEAEPEAEPFVATGTIPSSDSLPEFHLPVGVVGGGR